LIVAAVCAGFLPLNFPHARVFMGDVASVPLGFVFGALALYGLRTGVMDLAMAILIMAVFVVDATLTLLARAIRGERWYTAHNQHIYQRLIVQGWSHGRVLMVYQSINVLMILPAGVLAYTYPQYAIEITGLTLLVLVISWYIAFRKLNACAARRLL
jgi:Fuc2NAc and GlcNAc transferase